MALRLQAALAQIKKVEARNKGLLEEIVSLKAELVEANKERKILSRKVTIRKASVKEDFKVE